jgi:hypothetical protein
MALTVRAEDGWSVDSIVLAAPSGRAMLTLTIRSAAAGADAAAVATQHWRELAQQVPALVAAGERTLDADGTTVVVRRYAAGGERERANVTFLYAVAAGRAHIAALAEPDGLDDATLLSAADVVARASVVDAPTRMTVAYSPEELAVLAGLAGARAIPGLPAAPDDWGARHDAARRSLLARGAVVRGDDGRLTVHPARRELLGAVLRPRVVVSAERRGGGRREVRLLSASDAVGAAQAVTAEGIHVFTTFPARELVAQALTAAALPVGRAAARRGPMTVGVAELERLEAGAAQGGSAKGLPRAVATGRLRVLQRAAGERVEGGDVRWLDAGDDGLWSADPTGDGRALLTPVAPAAIAERFARMAS